jgi:hypothetical protein
METTGNVTSREPWNKKIVGQKAPFSSRTSGHSASVSRWMVAYANWRISIGIDSKLRGCDLLALKVRDVFHGDQVAAHAIVTQTRLKARYSSRSRQPPEMPCRRGSGRPG